MHWSQTESNKWSLESMFNHLARPVGVNNADSRSATSGHTTHERLLKRSSRHFLALFGRSSPCCKHEDESMHCAPNRDPRAASGRLLHLVVVGIATLPRAAYFFFFFSRLVRHFRPSLRVASSRSSSVFVSFRSQRPVFFSLDIICGALFGVDGGSHLQGSPHRASGEAAR